MKFKANTPTAGPLTPRQATQAKYNRSRANLLLVMIFTAINLFSVSFGDTYFLFSATFPMLFPAGAVGIAADTEFLASLGMTPESTSTIIIIGLVLGIIMTVPYLLCWIFSKKRPGWMVAALVFFSIDCLLLIGLYELSSIIPDLLMHAWVMFYLITGVKHGFKLKKMPEDEPLPSFADIVGEAEATPEVEVPVSDEAPVSDNAPAPAEEVAPESTETVTARSFDEIMADNEKKGL